MPRDKDNDRQGDGHGPETNPFVAFRRFADSQVSQLFNMVLTLPGTLTQSDAALRAKYECLFGQADEKACDELMQTERRQNEVLTEAIDQWQKGHPMSYPLWQHYLRLEHKSEKLRDRILGGSGPHPSLRIHPSTRRQEDWRGGSRDEPPHENPRTSHRSPAAFGENRARIEESSTFSDEMDDLSGDYSHLMPGRKYVVTRPGASGDPREAFGHLSPAVPSRNESAGDDHQHPKDPKASSLQRCASHCDRGVPDHPTKTRQPGAYPKPVPWAEDSDRGDPTHGEIPYEYEHDHEDQHDDAPVPQSSCGSAGARGPSTELDAYERLLGSTSQASGVSDSPKPSIISTLSTTERSIAADGTITTKVLFKKRFSDGREENSTSVHTERAKKSGKSIAPEITPEGPVPSRADQGRSSNSTGWFWSK
ncbi:hypothetical protein M011DRAFT_480960 [Sporormia fimetaria CBS 119925]|uniref:Uncharacterized protein n=1 Tax=Sporormia fimetaria CBS 119925 TaxID=1340428 RepID=A0A6A6UY35_9PLEO|nr:hypothetical protein M011DRAFT_480960 [Sporormia fimetaria CBS 119925]